MSDIFDVAIMTIFAREVLEGSIIIAEYRTLIFRCEQWPEGVERKDALRAVTVAALLASLFAIVLIVIIAIPLALLSRDFDARTSTIIEGVSKIIAAICILQLSLKMPKWLGVYKSKKKASSDSFVANLTLRSMKFNVAWNIWREVAECGVFLLPFFLAGDLKAIPLSALVGSLVGLLLGLGIYVANMKLSSKLWLALFSSGLLLLLSTGLFSGGCHNIEKVAGKTPQVWELQGDFWSVDRLPMTIFKPFGYSNTRTVLQIVSFWLWLLFGIALHARKYRASQRMEQAASAMTDSSVSMEDETNNEPVRDIEVQNDAGDITLATEPSMGSFGYQESESEMTRTSSRFR